MKQITYKRILLKLSGEALMGENKFGIDAKTLSQFADEIADIHKLNIEIGIVVGGGNIFRGIQAGDKGIDKISGDKMGMLATTINAIALRDALEKKDIETHIQTATPMPQIAEHFSVDRARKLLDNKKIVIFAGGTGNPLFTTDSAAALRAIEINADILIKATNVDGIYDSDPKKNPNAVLYKKLSFNDVLDKKLRVMDLTSIILCQENNKKVAVLNLHQKGNLTSFIKGDEIGSIVE